MSRPASPTRIALDRWENEGGHPAALTIARPFGPPRYLTEHYEVAGSGFQKFTEALAHARRGKANNL